MLATTERLPDYLPSMYLDHAQHRAMELEAIYRGAAGRGAPGGRGHAQNRNPPPGAALYRIA